MHTIQDKLEFSTRLKIALSAGAPNAKTTAEIAIQFNLRHEQGSVSNHAVYKWLNGQTIPTYEKIETLSEWLNVTTEWLRTGHEADNKSERLTSLDHVILKRLSRLPKPQKLLIIELMNNLKIDE